MPCNPASEGKRVRQSNDRQMTDSVKDVFDEFNPDMREALLMLRDLIFDTADTLPEIGPVKEVLRWGQPSYITPEKKAASTLRLGVRKDGAFGIYAHCQSSVISDFASLFPGQDRIDGNRAVLFDKIDQIDPARHGLLIKSALTYHL